MRASADDKLSSANDEMLQLLSQFDDAERNIDINRKKAIDTITEDVTKAVRKMLMSNLSSSGVKSRTGKLYNAVRNAVVYISFGGKSPKVVIRMPKSMSDYSKADGGGSFYRAANSIDAGSVHGTPNANKRERKNNKKNTLKRVDPGKGNSASGARGGTVRKGFDFWKLRPDQVSRIQKIVGDTFAKVVLE